MSVLETPRILLPRPDRLGPDRHQQLPEFYDEDTAESALPPAASTQGQVTAFRQQAIAAVAGGNWNPHGTHRSTFFETEVTGVDLGDGCRDRRSVHRYAVGLHGHAGRLRTYGRVSSQLFFDELTFGIPGGCLVTCPRSSR